MGFLKEIEEWVSAANKIKESMPEDILSITIRKDKPIDVHVFKEESFRQAFPEAKFYPASTTLDGAFVDTGEYTVSCYRMRQA